MSYTISEIATPTTLAEPSQAADDFREMVGVRNTIEADVVGNRDLGFEPDELLPMWNDPFEPKRLFVARVDGAIVGRGIYEVTRDDDTPEAWLSVEVLPEFRRQGIGTALLARAEAAAREGARTTLQGYFLTRSDVPGERLPSPTGFGSVPLDNESTRFALKHGYVLEQVERFSRLELPVAGELLDEQLAAATSAAGDDYRLVLWQGRTPENRLDDIALLSTRMSTDAPSAGLDVTEDVWDADRVRASDDRHESSPRISLVAAAEYVPTGALVAFTELSVPREENRPVSQEDTLVLKEHRGHRLGMLVKVGNLIQLRDTYPGRPSVVTFNAEENRHMLSVNEDVGFVAVGYEGAWQKRLS